MSSVLAAAPTKGKLIMRVMWADFTVPLSRNTEPQVGFHSYSCTLVMLETKLARDSCSFPR